MHYSTDFDEMEEVMNRALIAGCYLKETGTLRPIPLLFISYV